MKLFKQEEDIMKVMLKDFYNRSRKVKLPIGQKSQVQETKLLKHEWMKNSCLYCIFTKL
jgi:hypothetical protein